MPTCPCAGPPCWWVGPSLAGAGFRQAHRAAVLTLYLGVGWEGLALRARPSAPCGPWLCSWSSARLGLSDMGPVGGCLACGPLPSGPSPGQACGPGSRTPGCSGWFGGGGGLAKCVHPVTGGAWPFTGRGHILACAAWQSMADPTLASSALRSPPPRTFISCGFPSFVVKVSCCGILALPRAQVGPSDLCPPLVSYLDAPAL